MLNGIEANLYVNKTEKTRGKILYLDIFLRRLSCGEGMTEHNNHIMYVTWPRPKRDFATGVIFMAQLSEINFFDPLKMQIEKRTQDVFS